MCCVFISEQTVTFALYNKLIGFYSRDEKCLLCGTDWVFKMKQFTLRLYKV
jgi:hypothetical protein